MRKIDWTKQHCGVHQAQFKDLIRLMPDLECVRDTFPESVNDFIWDVKVHMLMPGQYPCIPNWHYDNVPRVNNKQDFDLVKQHAPMYLWLSGAPLTEFRDSSGSRTINAKEWVRFTQCDEHRGTSSKEFGWRGFIRATHKDIMPQIKVGMDHRRRHSQVYLDVNTFSW